MAYPSAVSPVIRAVSNVQGQSSSVGSVLGSLSCVMQRLGFEPPLSLR